MKHLHQNFTESREAYHAAVLYWRNLCEAIAELNRQKIEPFFGDHKSGVDSTIEEGAIWSGILPEQNRAFVIKQMLPTRTEIGVWASLDMFGINDLAVPI